MAQTSDAATPGTATPRTATHGTVPPRAPVPDAGRSLDAARSQRADLRQALLSVESAVTAPVPGRVEPWQQSVHDALIRLRTAWERHLAVTEGAGGVLDDVMQTAPHLGRAVDRIRSDHRVVEELLTGVTTSARRMDRVPEAATAVREQALGLLEALVRHRGRGSDLMYDAYATDVGGSE